MEDIQQFNKDIDDGLSEMHVVVKATKERNTCRQFETLKKELESTFPFLVGHVTFEEVPTAKNIIIVKRFIVATFIFAIVFTVFCTNYAFTNETMIYYSSIVKENRFQLLLLLYIGFVISSTAINSCNFDLYCDNELLFSKAEKYRFPTEEDAKQLIKQYIRENKGFVYEEKKTI